MNDTIQTLVRALLKIGGGYFVAKGFASDTTWETVTAGVLALVGVIWGVMHRTQDKGSSVPIRNTLNLFSLFLVAALLTACSSFVNTAQKSIYVGSQLADGSMKSYAVYWKEKTNSLGTATSDMLTQRSNVMTLSIKVGVSLDTADQALSSYAANVGTNSATKDVVNALIATAIQNAGNFAAEVAVITGQTNQAKP